MTVKQTSTTLIADAASRDEIELRVNQVRMFVYTDVNVWRMRVDPWMPRVNQVQMFVWTGVDVWRMSVNAACQPGMWMCGPVWTMEKGVDPWMLLAH